MTKVFDFKINPENHTVESDSSLEEALKDIDLNIKEIFEIFSDQVTSACTKTGAALFDVEKARIIRNTINVIFSAMLDTMDEEIVEYSSTYNKEDLH